MEITIVEEVCCRNGCGVSFWMTHGMRERFKKSHESFYCPHGHGQWYPSKTDEEILRERLAEKNNEIGILQEELRKKCKPKRKN